MIVALLLLACGSDPAPPPTTPAAAPPPASAPAARAVVKPGTTREASAVLTTEEPAALTKSQCGQMSHGGKTVDGCITAEIKCGETITGHTLGGADHFDSRFYRANFCTPDTTNHDGGDERIYRLVMPDGDWHADVWLDTPCADLDLGAMEWKGEGCPTASASINRCEMWPKRGTKREHVELVSQHGSTWLIVVEGKDDHEGAFGLTVECNEGLY